MKAVLRHITDLNSKELTETLKAVCAWGDEEILLLILNRDVKKVLGVRQYSDVVSQASRKDNRPLVVYWLEKHPEHEKIIVDPATVVDVSRNGFIDILPILIQHVRPTRSFEKTLNQCLQAASRNGHGEAVQYLIGKGAGVNFAVEEVRYTGDGDEPSDSDIRYSYKNKYACTGKLSALQAALLGFERFCPEPERSFSQPRSQASWIGADTLSQERCVGILLAEGADPNRANEYERYPLNIAAACCTVEIVQKLISSGARVEAATKRYGTALEAAARRETDGLLIINAILESNEPGPPTDSSKAAALNEALSFFKNLIKNPRYARGHFKFQTSINNVLCTGPGAAVKNLLAHLPNERTDDSRYSLLLQMACMAGDRKCVKILLQRGIDINKTCGYYGTALQAASRVGNIEIVNHLLNARADVNILRGAHSTALRAAVLGGHEDIVCLLIAYGADINLSGADDENGDDSVLHLALKSRSDANFMALLLAGAAVTTARSNNKHILITVCKQGHAALVEPLLASGVDVNISDTHPCRNIPDMAATPLIAACAEGHPSVVRLLLDHKADIEKTVETSETPLMAAVGGNNVSVIRLLLDAHADFNHAVRCFERWQRDERGGLWLGPPSRATAWDTPLSVAAQNSKLEILEELLSAGAIIGGPLAPRNALAGACNNHQHMAVELLLETLSGSQHEAAICDEALYEILVGGDPGMSYLLLERVASPSFHLLRRACSAGELEAVEMLVNTGIDVNDNGGVDGPLLHVAASHSRPEVVQYLLNRGANVMLRSPIYGSPVIAALEGSIAPVLRYYMQPKSCQSLAWQLPLPGAVPNSHIMEGTKVRQCEQIVQSLFEAGAEMDTTVRAFGNALHLASYMGSQVIVRHLLQRMKNVNIFGGYFESPLNAAVLGQHEVIAELLLDRGIEVNRAAPEYGSTLGCACSYGSKKLIQNLLDRGADVNAHVGTTHSVLVAVLYSNAGSTMRSVGARSSKEKLEIIELLLGHEPKVHVRECDLLAAISSDSWNYGDGPCLQASF